MKVAIIKYNAGNIRSVVFALERCGVNAIVTDDAAEINSADKIIFPGVGEASSAMRYLQSKNLDKLIVDLKQPVLGICLGMQLMCNYSEEGKTKCLGIIDADVKQFIGGEKIPHVGWNTINQLNTNLFNGIAENEYVYFVHGFYVPLNSFSIATANYIVNYSCAVQNGNFYAVQFHPEKSATVGEKILNNFLSL
jgi:glutamine amidotransferase